MPTRNSNKSVHMNKIDQFRNLEAIYPKLRYYTNLRTKAHTTFFEDAFE